MQKLIMPAEFENRVAVFLESEELFAPTERIVLAVSGGADSVCLLHAICSLKAEGLFGGEIIVAHINHRLRGSESDGDEKFVVAEAGRLGLPIVCREVDVGRFAEDNKLSIETAGRQVRIESLIDIAGEHGCRVIAFAHHKDDLAETVIQRLARGTGFRGLAGIWPVRDFG